MLEVLSQERLGRAFTGDTKSMRDLMTEITVFDIFVVTSALKQSPDLVAGYDISAAPADYEEWVSRYRVDPGLHTSMDSLVIDEPQPKRHAPERTLPLASPNSSGGSGATAVASTSKASAPAKAAVVKKRAEPAKKAKPDPGTKPQTSAAERRPSSPVSQQVQMTYASVASSREKRRLNWLRQIPTIEDGNLESVRKSVIRGDRYKSANLLKAIPSATVKSDWRQVFDTLGNVYQPTTLFYISGSKSGVAFVEDCPKWKTLPTFVYTKDKAFFDKYAGGKEFLSLCELVMKCYIFYDFTILTCWSSTNKNIYS